MGVDALDPRVASELAGALRTIVGFPWDADVVRSTAEDLMSWCTGAIVENRVWPAEAQARWLVREARENWDKWLGTVALRGLFRDKFQPRPRAGSESGPLGPRPPVQCAVCKDSGILVEHRKHRYCDCEMGISLEIAPNLGERYLKKMDDSIAPKRQEPAPKVGGLSRLEWEALYYAALEPREAAQDGLQGN
jgi:hypothetical protein